MTAWHVLEEIGAAVGVDADPLASEDPFAVAIRRMDPVHDLAVLVSEASLPTMARALTSTDQMELRTPVTATGHAALEDRDSTFRFLNAAGQWAGGSTRNEAIPLVQMIADVVKAAENRRGYQRGVRANCTPELIGKAAKKAVLPDTVEMEFGSATNSVIVAGAVGEPMLKATLTYEVKEQLGNRQSKGFSD